MVYVVVTRKPCVDNSLFVYYAKVDTPDMATKLVLDRYPDEAVIQVFAMFVFPEEEDTMHYLGSIYTGKILDLGA